MTIAPAASTLASVMGSTTATPVQSANASSTGSTPTASSPITEAEHVQLPPQPMQTTTYPKSLIPQPFPPSFPTVHLPPPDPAGLSSDTVSISDAGRKAAAAAGNGAVEQVSAA